MNGDRLKANAKCAQHQHGHEDDDAGVFVNTSTELEEVWLKEVAQVDRRPSTIGFVLKRQTDIFVSDKFNDVSYLTNDRRERIQEQQHKNIQPEVDVIDRQLLAASSIDSTWFTHVWVACETWSSKKETFLGDFSLSALWCWMRFHDDVLDSSTGLFSCSSEFLWNNGDHKAAIKPHGVWRTWTERKLKRNSRNIAKAINSMKRGDPRLSNDFKKQLMRAYQWLLRNSKCFSFSTKKKNFFQKWLKLH